MVPFWWRFIVRSFIFICVHHKFISFSYAYVCNILSVILRANFDDPVDTVADILARNMTLYDQEGAEMWKQWLLQHHDEDFNRLAEKIIFADVNETTYLIQKALKPERTHVTMSSHLDYFQFYFGKHPDLSGRMIDKGGKIWYRSKQKIDNYPNVGYMTRKKWRFDEVYESN